MSRPKIRVQHMVAGHSVRQYGSNPTSDLLGVAYRIIYSPDTEFPVTVPQIDVFTRFFVEHPGTDEFVVRVWSLGVSGQQPSFVRAFGPHRVIFPVDEVHLDCRFRVKYLQAPRPGMYALRLCRPKAGWRGVRWSILATEYILINRG